MNAFAAWFTLLLYLAFASARWRALWKRAIARAGDATVAFLLLPMLLATGFRPSLPTLAAFALYLAFPVMLLRFRPKRHRPMDLIHILVVLGIWLPLEPSLFAMPFERLFGAGAAAWVHWLALPEVRASLLPGVDLPIDKLTGILLALYLFLIRDPLPRLGFDFRFRLSDLGYAAAGWVLFAVVGIPLGLGMGFLRVHVVIPPWPELLSMILGGYLLIALAEEILFRGVIQNLLTQRWGSWPAGLAVAAIIFGAAHLNNATPGFPEPNWAYMLMATLAGLAYGWVWWKTGRVTASALTHMSVNLVWGILFVS